MDPRSAQLRAARAAPELCIVWTLIVESLSVQSVGGDSGAIITTLITLARFLLGEPHGITVPLPDLAF